MDNLKYIHHSYCFRISAFIDINIFIDEKRFLLEVWIVCKGGCRLKLGGQNLIAGSLGSVQKL